MPLHEMQMALGAMVIAPKSASALDELSLTTREHAWLNRVAGSAGFDVTCDIQRWWRATRLRMIVRLTLAAMGERQAELLLRSYIESVPFSSFFFIPEALSFLEYAIEHAPHAPHFLSAASFERAMLLASDAAPSQSRPARPTVRLRASQKIRRNPAASIVEFDAPPEALLAALLFGEPLPASQGESFPVLVAPGLPHLWRDASPCEAELFYRCETAATVATLLSMTKAPKESLRELLSVGALCFED